MTPEIEEQLKSEIASLKELIEVKLKALESITEERFIATSNALKIQASEYERRLNALNGEAERLRQMQSSYILREVYEANQKDLNDKVNILVVSEKKNQGKSEGISASWLVIVVVIGLAVSIAGLIVSVVR